jgi:hypothetical protein
MATAVLPEGVGRGEFLRSGLGFVLAMLAASLVLRSAYSLGFTKAFKILTSRQINPVTVCAMAISAATPAASSWTLAARVNAPHHAAPLPGLKTRSRRSSVRGSHDGSS